jgi:hypothetical protein
MPTRPPTNAELDELATRADAAPAGAWRKQDGDAADHFTLRGGSAAGDLHLFAPGEAGEAITRLLDAARTDMPRLVDEVRRLRAEVDTLQSESRPAPRAAETKARPALDIADDAPLALSAAFHVGPKEMKAAASDPLAALAVQVARALQPDAKEVERARLIAMAFAATRGHMDDFWAARKMRGGGKKADAKAGGAGKKK